MKAITCINCGVEGVLNVPGLENDGSLKVFKRVGRNHVSGHLHYLCPVCNVVLLVDPVLIRKSDHIFRKKEKKYQRMVPSSANNLPGIYTVPGHSYV
ncbi:MAG: hypothetical protein ABFD75_06410 [Smithella sp.]